MWLNLVPSKSSLAAFGVFLRKFGYFRENLRKSGNSVTAKGRHSWPCCNGLVQNHCKWSQMKTFDVHQ